MRRLILTVLASALPLSLAIAGNDGYIPLEQRLDRMQMQQTGLDQLSPAQLHLLNRLLSEEQSSQIATAKAQGSREAAAGKPLARDREPVTSRIVGPVRGWSTGQVLALENGQHWRVLQGELFLRKPVDDPQVHLAPSNMGAWYLQMPGQNQRAKVERID
ncbi:hypothetical protein [Stenotrophomonas sp. YIM B06876]|uniref:hypothetical protein n=1 Tax=Stenotrophomonas sp. YIM B06876 TaxID=3060211 RepID=UPI00273A5346|nr:hypothetical protein [Stenotrophomonas sp. YIM B06876]